MRPDRDTYFMIIAHAVSLRSTCKSRNVGCVLVNSQYHILSTGYNGPASKMPECNPCHRLGKPSGEGLLDSCVAIHAEQNALIQCPDIWSIHTAYVTTSPCLTCIKLLLNTQCKKIVFMDEYAHNSALEMWSYAGREWIRMKINVDTLQTMFKMNQIRSNL
jgi:dCMP deaminase